MKNLRKLFLVCILVNLFFLAFAQETENKKIQLTVEQAVDYALENSKSLKSASIDLEMKKRANAFSWNTFLPSASVGGSMSRTTEYPSYSTLKSLASQKSFYESLAYGFAADGNYNTAAVCQAIADSMVPGDYEEIDRWSAVGSVSLQWSFNVAMIDSLRIAHVNYENGKITWEETISETKNNIKKLFYSLLIMQESLNIQKENLEAARLRYEQANANFSNGYVSQLQVLNSQVSYENQKPTVLSSEQQLKQQMNMFAFLIGLPFGTEIELLGDINPTYVEADADELFRKYCDKNPKIISMRNNIKIAKMSLNAQRMAAYTPSISLSYAWQPYVINLEKNWFDSENSTDSGSLSLTVGFSDLLGALPFGANGQKIKDAKQQILQAEIGLETMIQNMEIEVHSLVDNLYKSQSNIEAMERNVELATRAYNSTIKAYNSGTQELLDVKDAENSLSQAKLGLMNEKLNYISAVLDLEQKLNIKLGVQSE